jgi:hypothetical protein
MTQEELASLWEARHGRPSGLLATKAATDPGQVSHLTPELQARLALFGHDHVPAGPCTHPMPNGAETWDGKCAEHKGTPAQRAEQRRWQAKAAAVWDAQTLGRQGDMVVVLTQDEAIQRDSYFGPAPVVDRVRLELL